jgi:hypothetical protein
MENTVSKAVDQTPVSSSLFTLSRKAFNLIREGKEKQARLEFPLEYHFIKKYLPSSIDELTFFLRSKLQIF